MGLIIRDPLQNWLSLFLLRRVCTFWLYSFSDCIPGRLNEAVIFSVMDSYPRPIRKQTGCPQKGAFTGEIAGNSSLPKPRWVNFIATQLINSRQGSHGPLQTRPSIQAQSKTLSPSATLMSAFYFITTWTTMGINLSRPNFNANHFSKIYFYNQFS
jgi:hypothetical protein